MLFYVGTLSCVDRARNKTFKQKTQNLKISRAYIVFCKYRKHEIRRLSDKTMDKRLMYTSILIYTINSVD